MLNINNIDLSHINRGKKKFAKSDKYNQDVITDETKKMVLKILKKDRGMSIRAIEESTNLCNYFVFRVVKALEQDNLVTREKRQSGKNYKMTYVWLK